MKLISLGRNCEVSFQIQKNCNEGWDAGLFSWAYILDDRLLIPAMNDPDDLLRSEVHFHYPTDDMFLDEKYQITFHGKTPKSEMFDETNRIIDEEKYRADLEELRSRVAHLADKFRADLASEEPMAYIYKLVLNDSDPQYIREKLAFVNDLYAWLRDHKSGSSWKLVIVVQEAFAEAFSKLANGQLLIDSVSYFAPDSDTLNGADQESWHRIILRIAEALRSLPA